VGKTWGKLVGFGCGKAQAVQHKHQGAGQDKPEPAWPKSFTSEKTKKKSGPTIVGEARKARPGPPPFPYLLKKEGLGRKKKKVIGANNWEKGGGS